MTPEDKAMTEKAMMSGNNAGGVAGKMLLKDLPSSAIDMAAAVVAKKDGKADVAVPTAPTSTETSPPASTTPVAPVAAPAEPKKKGFLKSIFRRKPKEVVVEPELTSDVAEQLTNESLLKMIDDKLHKISGDEFLVIKISKQGLLLLVGFLLALIWLSPLIEMNLPKILNMVRGQASPPIPEVMASPTPLPLTASTIRVRMGSNSLEAANEIKGLLTAAGFDHVDLIYDPQVNPKSLLIVTKQTDMTLQQTLEQLFVENYFVASESAELTSDSDFAASILVGKSSKIVLK